MYKLFNQSIPDRLRWLCYLLPFSAPTEIPYKKHSRHSDGCITTDPDILLPSDLLVKHLLLFRFPSQIVRKRWLGVGMTVEFDS